MSETQIAKSNSSVKEWLGSSKLKNQLAAAMPQHCTPDRMMRVISTAMTKTPKLQNCSKASLFSAFMTCSELGLEPNGIHAHLVPFKKTCQLILDYKGLVELVMRTKKVSYLHADKVCEFDTFDYSKGELRDHIIDFKTPRGKAYAYYALARMVDGGEVCVVMTLDEVNEIRERSQAGGDGPWVTDFDEMAKKTVFKRLSKWLPISAEVLDQINQDEDTIAPEQKIDGPDIDGMMQAEAADEEEDEDDSNPELEAAEPEKKPEPKPKAKAKAKAAPKKEEPKEDLKLEGEEQQSEEVKETLFPEPRNADLEKILKYAETDGITEEQLKKFSDERALDMYKEEHAAKVATNWQHIVGDLKRM